MPSGKRPRIQKGEAISARFLNELARWLAQRVTGGRGINVRRTGTDITIETSVQSGGGGGSSGKWFRITASTQDGGNDRWTYTGTEIRKTSAGYDGWVDHTDGLTGQTLYSLSEDQQTGDVTAGGVDDTGADYPAGFSRMPIQDGTRVFCRGVDATSGTSTIREYWILNMGTLDDGTCT